MTRDETQDAFIELRTLTAGPRYELLRERLVRAHMGLARYLAKRYRNRGIPMDDLEQVAYIALIKSVDRYDPARGLEFSTYATPTITGEIKRHFRDKGWMVRAPRRVQENKLRVYQGIEAWTKHYGAEPTHSELATFLSITEAEVQEALLAGNAYSTSSLDAPVYGREPDDGPDGIDPGYTPDEFESVEMRQSLKKYILRLPEREQRALYMRFWEYRTQSDIANELGVSQMHVSRILAKTLAALKRSVTEDTE